MILALLLAQSIVITGVSVIPMDRERLLPDQTVVVRGGRIAAIGPQTSVTIPAGAQRIDGAGKFLIPGLADMHAHLQSDFGYLADSLAADELMVMLANGVTTARIMIGRPLHLALRDSVNRGRLASPALILGSPQLAGRSFAEPHFNGHVVGTPEQARAAVKSAKAGGYDFIKITFFISRPVYEAIVEEAAAQGIRIVGHVDPEVGLARALAAGQQVEHLDGYLEAVLAPSSPLPQSVSGVYIWRRPHWETLDHIDSTRFAVVAGQTSHAKGVAAFATPTLTFLKLAFGTGQADEEIRSRPDWKFLSAKSREEMAGPRNAYWKDPPPEARRMRFVSTRSAIVKAMADSGVKLMAGSDAPDWFLNYGWTLHRELQNMVASGVTPYQALLSATRYPAEFAALLRAGMPAAESGTVAVGRRADLVLLDANPLTDIHNTLKIHGVMAAGRWMTREGIDSALARSEARIQGSP